jgi:hypothetical protein
MHSLIKALSLHNCKKLRNATANRNLKHWITRASGARGRSDAAPLSAHYFTAPSPVAHSSSLFVGSSNHKPGHEAAESADSAHSRRARRCSMYAGRSPLSLAGIRIRSFEADREVTFKLAMRFNLNALKMFVIESSLNSRTWAAVWASRRARASPGGAWGGSYLRVARVCVCVDVAVNGGLWREIKV